VQVCVLSFLPPPHFGIFLTFLVPKGMRTLFLVLPAILFYYLLIKCTMKSIL
jgi:hypothetical protein